jgi:ribosome-associated protein
LLTQTKEIILIFGNIVNEQLKKQHLSVRSAESAGPAKLTRLNRNSKILKVIINAIQDKKGENVISLDLRKIPEAVADYFIVCDASSTVQVKAIADWVEAQVKKECGEPPYKHEGHTAAQWILVDYVNVVVHVFLSETRKFYRLEEMWGDGDVEEEKLQEPIVRQAPAGRTKKTTKQQNA